MSDRRFLIGLREFETSECILATRSLCNKNPKGSINIYEEDFRPERDDSDSLTSFNSKITEITRDIEECMLDADGIEVTALIADYVAKKIMNKRQCDTCSNLSVATERFLKENDYLLKLSRRGLIVPSIDLCHYVAKCFSILDISQHIIKESSLPERSGAELVLKLNDYPTTFLCVDHTIMSLKF